jgi:ABC-type phosphate transport system substrate-binding protein
MRAALLTAALAGALAIPSIAAPSASASLDCGGSAIEGAGSSLQELAQESLWGPGFNGAGGVCPGGPSISHAAGAWNETCQPGQIDTEFSFVETESPPNATEMKCIEEAAGGANVIVTPVASTSISIIANPPPGCRFAEETGISNLDLQKVFRGSLTTWAGLETTEGTCNAPITRVVPRNASGATSQFKTYLSRMNGGMEPCVGRTWLELRSSSGTPSPNVTWPEECPGNKLSPVARAAADGGGSAVTKTDETEGGIGYVATPELKTSGTTESLVTVALQNNGKTKSTEANFAAPELGTAANCFATPFFVPINSRPIHFFATGISIDWSNTNGVFPNIGGSGYSLCVLTYILTLRGMSLVNAGQVAPEPQPFTLGQYTTINDYLHEYIVQPAGQANLETEYYSPLPSAQVDWLDVISAARFSASKTSW